jgi:hypothetical protein
MSLLHACSEDGLFGDDNLLSAMVLLFLKRSSHRSSAESFNLESGVVAGVLVLRSCQVRGPLPTFRHRLGKQNGMPLRGKSAWK